MNLQCFINPTSTLPGPPVGSFTIGVGSALPLHPGLCTLAECYFGGDYLACGLGALLYAVTWLKLAYILSGNEQAPLDFASII